MLRDDRAAKSFEAAPAPEQSAVDAGLRYVHDREPGFRRERQGRGFRFFDHENLPISCDRALHRIQSLAIPPAWRDVWICRFTNGHLQATGRDQKTRKQYRYHPQWSEVRNQTKFERLLMVGEALPALRARLEADLQKPGLPRDKVLAAVVKIMQLTRIRVGNEVYAEQNGSYGLTTILNQHARVRGSEVRFRFRGKSGVLHEVGFSDPKLSRMIKQCQELPGQELFGYLDDEGQAHDVGSQDVNQYLKDITGLEISAKDFRTWAGTAHALECLCDLGPCEKSTKRALKEREMQIFRSTAEHLGNTVAVCRKYYVHPRLWQWDQERKGTLRAARASGLSVAEQKLLGLLRAWNREGLKA